MSSVILALAKLSLEQYCQKGEMVLNSLEHHCSSLLLPLAVLNPVHTVHGTCFVPKLPWERKKRPCAQKL